MKRLVAVAFLCMTLLVQGCAVYTPAYNYPAYGGYGYPQPYGYPAYGPAYGIAVPYPYFRFGWGYGHGWGGRGWGGHGWHH